MRKPKCDKCRRSDEDMVLIRVLACGRLWPQRLCTDCYDKDKRQWDQPVWPLLPLQYFADADRNDEGW